MSRSLKESVWDDAGVPAARFRAAVRGRLWIFVALAALPAIPARSNDVLLEHVDVFVNEEVIEGLVYDTYRIPNIARTNDGTLIAVAEARLTSAADPGGTHIDLVYKRSTDGGRTWSEGRLLDRHPGTVLSAAGVPTNRTSASNSVTFVDRTNGRLWNMNLRLPSGVPAASVRAGVDDMQTWGRFSDDSGLTWSEPSRIQLPQYEDFYPNLGSTTQLANGRLVVPATEIIPRVTSKSFALFSDDQGATWYAGDLVDAGTNEAQIIELNDGRLLMSARQNGGGGRVFSHSLDQGATWQPPFTGFNSTAVMEAIERFELTGPDGRPQSLLVHTRPAGGAVTARTNLEVLVATNETSPGGPTFGGNRMVFQGWAAYSDLVGIDGDEMGVFWERGDTGHNQSIVYTRFNDTFLKPAGQLGLIAHEGFDYAAGVTLADTRGGPAVPAYTGGYAPVNFSSRTDLDLVFTVAMGTSGGGTTTVDPGLPRNDQANGVYGQIFSTGSEAGAVTQISVQRAPNGTAASNLFLHLYADTDLSNGIDAATFLGSSTAAAALSPTNAGVTSWSFQPGGVVLAPESQYFFAFANSSTPGDTTTARASLIVSQARDGYAIGGNGFNSAWHATATDLTAGPGAAAAEIVAGSLDRAGLNLNSAGNHARLATGGTLARGLGVGLDLDSDATYYASLLVTRAADTGPDGGADEAFSVRFLDAGGTTHVAFGVGDDESFFLDGPGGLVRTAADTLDPAETYLLLLKIESRSREAADAFDRVFLKAFGADDPIPTIEDGIIWTLVGNPSGDSAGLLDRLAIQGGRSAVWSFDELRVAGDFAAVAGGLTVAAQSVPEPALFGTVAVGIAAGELGRRRRSRRSDQ